MPKVKVMPTTLPDMIRLHESVALLDREIVQDVSVAILSSGLSPRDLAKIQQFNVAGYITKPSTLKDSLRVGLSLKALLVEHGSLGQSAGSAGGRRMDCRVQKGLL